MTDERVGETKAKWLPWVLVVFVICADCGCVVPDMEDAKAQHRHWHEEVHDGIQ